MKPKLAQWLWNFIFHVIRFYFHHFCTVASNSIQLYPLLFLPLSLFNRVFFPDHSYPQTSPQNLTFLLFGGTAVLLFSAKMSYDGSEKSLVSVGPYGGRCGVPWDDGIYCGVKKITITHGAAINSIQIEYDAGGKLVLSEMHGSYGYNTDKIHFDLPNEYITFVTGHYGSLDEDGPVYVRSLAFESNKRRYGPFGIALEIPFAIPITGSSVVGFHGRSSFYLDSIGVHLRPLLQRNLPLKPDSIGVQPRPLAQLNPPRRSNESERMTGSCDVIVDDFARNEKVPKVTEVTKRFPNMMRNFQRRDENSSVQNPVFAGYKTSEKVPTVANAGRGLSSVTQALRSEKVDLFYPSNGNYGKAEIKETEKMKPVASLGPWGGVGGMPFDDGPHSAVYEIHLARSSAGVVSIRARYEINGRIVWGNTNGGIGGNRLDKITFDYPREYLTRVSGWYASSTFRGLTIVKSITFYTNVTKYGPFGEEQGTHFSSESREGTTITGFHGTKGDLLESIGVYVM